VRVSHKYSLEEFLHSNNFFTTLGTNRPQQLFFPHFVSSYYFLNNEIFILQLINYINTLTKGNFQK